MSPSMEAHWFLRVQLAPGQGSQPGISADEHLELFKEYDRESPIGGLALSHNWRATSIIRFGSPHPSAPVLSGQN